MSFNQIYPLEAISEVSTETSMSQLDLSQVSTTGSTDNPDSEVVPSTTVGGEMMPSLLGPAFDEADGGDSELEFQPVASDAEDVDSTTGTVERFEDEVAVSMEEESSPALLSTVDLEPQSPDTTFFEEEEDVEKGVVILPEPSAEPNVSMTEEPEEFAAASLQSPGKAPSLINDEPSPTTPSPFKANKESHSPTVTEPISPDKAYYDGEESKFATSRHRRVCGCSRSFLIGMLVVAIGVLVGIVLVVKSGGGSSSSTDLPSDNGVPNEDIAPSPSRDVGGDSPQAPQPSPPGQASAPAPPTTAPTSEPTSEPTMSPAPTSMPTPEWGDVLPHLVNLTSQELLTDATTMQGQALLWLLDALYVNPTEDPDAIRQRYAMTVLDRATHGGGARVTRVHDHECEWTGVSCTNETVTTVNWSGSSLTGSLPEEISVLSSMTTLDVGENSLTGPLPDGLFQCTSLEYLYLHENEFSGTLSEDFSNLYDLQRLYLGQNGFSGNLPQGLGSTASRGLRRLRFLSLHDNDLTGPIPENWNLRFVYLLDLSHNRLSGNLPSDWGDSGLARVKLLYIDHNELSGPVPSTYPSMGNGRMELFHLSDNQLTGRMPGGFNPIFFISSFEFQNNLFSSMDPTICNSLVWVQGEITNFHADCNICICQVFCDSAHCF